MPDDWLLHQVERALKDREGKPEEEPRWHPEPPSMSDDYDGGCEWPFRACFNTKLPCNQCPYHK